LTLGNAVNCSNRGVFLFPFFILSMLVNIVHQCSGFSKQCPSSVCFLQVSRSSDIPISRCSKNHVTTALISHLRTQIREVALVHLNTYLATANVQEPAFVPAFQIVIFFLWHLDPIPGH
jgi:hypothetical protein